VIFNFLFWGFGFLRMGTTGFVAQAYGTGDATEVRSTLARALLLAGVLGLTIVLLQKPIGNVAFWALHGGADLESLAASYYAIRVWSAPAALANYAVLGCLIGMHNTRAALVLQLVLNVSNVLLDLLFVLGFGWGVAGVALASLLSEYLALAFGWRLVRANFQRIGGEWNRSHILYTPRLRALLHVNVNIFVRTLSLIAAFFYFTAMGTRLGEVTLAANAVLLHLHYFVSYGLDGFAHAAEALAGSAYGARRRAAFRAAVKATTLWALIIAVAYSAVYATFGHLIIGIITGIETVRLAAADYLPWVLLLPIVSVWSYQFDGIYIATTRPVEMRNSMLLSFLTYIVASWLFIPLWHNHGLWLAFMIFMAMRGITLGLWFPRIERSIPQILTRKE
ncbi:MAG: MATE family efflux transporter, partial [Acidiferrobacterales bacterium]|nr:MATE family efflux transporter [Acidiferrobacterales bacterium]